jgi:hypothetical protein
MALIQALRYGLDFLSAASLFEPQRCLSAAIKLTPYHFISSPTADSHVLGTVAKSRIKFSLCHAGFVF